MSVSWKPWPNLFFICLLLSATKVVPEEFQLQPLNSTVLQGSDVRFNATVQGAWEVMTWHVEGLLVLSVSANVTSSSKQFSARFCSDGDNGCVEFTIHNVTRRQSGPVTCSVLGVYGSKTAQLYVQESGTIDIMGGNVTAVQDQQVKFQCVTSAWFPKPNVVWSRNGEAVNGSLYNTTSTPSGDSFNATSVLTFPAVSNTTVECLATVPTLPNPLSSSVLLVVVPKPTDWTVLIAVVVSIGGFALLVLLIIGIIFCCRRKKEKEPNYQEEMSRRVRTQSQISTASTAGQRHGHLNAGYLQEGQTTASPSERSDSGFSQQNGSNGCEVPDVVNSNQADGFSALDESGVRKHRHVTIV